MFSQKSYVGSEMELFDYGRLRGAAMRSACDPIYGFKYFEASPGSFLGL